MKPPSFTALAFLGLLALTGCKWLTSPKGAALVASDVACILAHDNDPPMLVVSECHLISDAISEVETILAEEKKAKARALAAARCAPPPDAGVP